MGCSAVKKQLERCFFAGDDPELFFALTPRSAGSSQLVGYARSRCYCFLLLFLKQQFRGLVGCGGGWLIVENSRGVIDSFWAFHWVIMVNEEKHRLDLRFLPTISRISEITIF